MNMENVKRSIQIEEVKDDIFSDDIKTTALIEEIEAAEVAARQANIDKQIELSRPTRVQAMCDRLGKITDDFMNNVHEKMAELKEKQPKDPRVKKINLKKKLSIKVKQINQSKSTIRVKLPKAKPISNTKSHSSQSLADRVNALAPQGVPKKTVAEIAVVAALVVTGIEIWTWNFSHPLFPNNTKDEISVPITGSSTEIEEDSPFKNQENSKTDTDKTEEKQESNTSTDSSSNSNINTGSSYYIYTANNQSAPVKSTSSKTTKNSSTTAVNRNTYTGTTIDNGWNDEADTNWPVYEEPEDPVVEPAVEPVVDPVVEPVDVSDESNDTTENTPSSTDDNPE